MHPFSRIIVFHTLYNFIRQEFSPLIFSDYFFLGQQHDLILLSCLRVRASLALLNNFP